ncbi:MAG: UDP-3-O-(3-hydroxymyristoyl)glucosamine N-acyltransferase [Ginsengibacter sp.]
MQFPSPVSVSWIADFINAKILGNTDSSASGINEIHKVKKGDIVFVDHPKYFETCLNSAATCIIINAETNIPEGKTLFVVDDPFEAYLKIVNHFKPFVASGKMISDTAKIGKNSIIMPNVFLGNNVTIRDNCIIHPNVIIYDDCVIGNHVEIHSGTVIGSDAFYFNTKKNRQNWYKKMQSCGQVIIEDNVEIGANCTIDRGVSDSTIIGRGTKMDNLIHVGHDVVMGKNCLIAAQVGIAGGTILGDGVTLWGQVGVNKTISIGDNAIVMGQGGVTSSIEANKTYWGTPIQEFYSKRKELVLIKRLPEIWEKIKMLSSQNDKNDSEKNSIKK